MRRDASSNSTRQSGDGPDALRDAGDVITANKRRGRDDSSQRCGQSATLIREVSGLCRKLSLYSVRSVRRGEGGGCVLERVNLELGMHSGRLLDIIRFAEAEILCMVWKTVAEALDESWVLSGQYLCFFAKVFGDSFHKQLLSFSVWKGGWVISDVLHRWEHHSRT